MLRVSDIRKHFGGETVIDGVSFVLNEGERLVIGGVTQTVNQNTIRKVPFLGDIPFLGWAFKQRENFEAGRELVIFLTPSVLKTVTSQAMSPK